MKSLPDKVCEGCGGLAGIVLLVPVFCDSVRAKASLTPELIWVDSYESFAVGVFCSHFFVGFLFRKVNLSPCNLVLET